MQKKKNVTKVVNDEKFLTFFLQQNFELQNFPWLGLIILKNFLNFVNLFSFWTKILVKGTDLSKEQKSKLQLSVNQREIQVVVFFRVTSKRDRIAYHWKRKVICKLNIFSFVDFLHSPVTFLERVLKLTAPLAKTLTDHVLNV